MKQEEVWVLADDRPGNVAQALGVAEALGAPFAVKQIRYDRWGRAHNFLRGSSLLGVEASSRSTLIPPWPRLVIGAGRRTAPVARWIKRQAACRLVQIMDPGWPGRDAFDLIAQPLHDGVSERGNVFQTLGSCHRAFPAVLSREGAKWAARLTGLPRPYLLVVVGGGTKDYSFDAARGRELAAGVRAMREKFGGSILMTTSRRTSADLENILFAAAPSPSYLHRWQPAGENPYLGFLALADRVVVTGDSMTMCSEACANGGPVYIFAPDAMVTGKHARLHQALFERGFARPLDGGSLETWRHPSLNAAADVAQEIRRRSLL